MTGHSLGGSVAQVVGAKEALPAITYSAPGIVYSRRHISLHYWQKTLNNNTHVTTHLFACMNRKFGVDFDSIQQWTATIRYHLPPVIHRCLLDSVLLDC